MTVRSKYQVRSAGRCVANVRPAASRSVGTALTLVALALTLVSPPDAAALTDAEISCRKQIADVARKALDRYMSARVKCIQLRANGKVDPTVDCLADPEELGGDGTGHLKTDRRLAKVAIKGERSGRKIDRKCLKDPTDEVIPSELGVDDLCTPATEDWEEIGPCIYELASAAANLVAPVVHVQNPGPLPSLEQACLDTMFTFTRRALRQMIHRRARCYERDDKTTDGGGGLECDATIMPYGVVVTTLDAATDRNVGERFPLLDLAVRENCDVPLDSIGFDAVPGLPDMTGVRFVDRRTLDDVLHALNDVINEAVHLVLYGDTGTEGIFTIPAVLGSGFCGDGAMDPGEECDDGNNISCDGGCDRDCTLAACGNGAVCQDDLEECDDGNLVAGDGCSDTCQLELCGNGIQNPGWDEECDDAGESFDCDTDCTLAFCGDGQNNATRGETCDDGLGTPTNTATCDSDCTDPACPDGHFNPLNTNGPAPATGEECDDGGETATCDSDCSLAFCGDGDLNPTRGEACDDGNNDDDDPCVSSDSVVGSNCQVAFCGDGFDCDSGICVTEQCDDGTGTPGSSESLTCNNDCTTQSCGDGKLNTSAGEECDDGGLNAANRPCVDNGGSLVCVIAECGDGETCSAVTCTSGPGGAEEECDDADGDHNDPCLNTCATATCGDGVLCSDGACTTGPGGGVEECDDSGESPECDSDCSIATCGDGQINTQNVTPPATAGGEVCDDGGESATCDANCTPAACGDSTINATAGEECDEGASNGADMPCVDNGGSLVCQVAECGDGEICSDASCDTAGEGVPEDCDDSGESATCDINCTDAICGDGDINASAGEECDDGTGLPGTAESANCDVDCSAAFCGDGTTNTQHVPPGNTAGNVEECDDGAGNGNGADECRDGSGIAERCQNPFCGDGVTDSGETCDDGLSNGTGEGFCLSDCSGVQTCGDGATEGTETCDDGFTDACGTCNATCTAAGTGPGACGDGAHCPEFEFCDDGFNTACGACNATCTAAGSGGVCGDGATCPDLGETCDDGFTDACGTCNATCNGAGSGQTCGDGFICPETETCDDGVIPPLACGVCNATCDGAGTGGETCGDGTTCAETEECDDGGVVNGDGCSSLCLEERIVFQTNAVYGPGVDFGSRAGADALCQSDATTAGLTGTYRAWISDGTGSPAASWGGPPTGANGATGPFILAGSGTRVADDWAELTSGTLQTAISTDESGGAPVAGTSPCTGAFDGVWTNTADNGSNLSGDHCSNWSSSSGALPARTGDGGSTTAWTDGCFAGSGICNTTENLYCVQQDLP